MPPWNHAHPNPPALPLTADNWDLTDSTRTDNRPDCELNVVDKEGSFFGFPFCHTGPAGGNVDVRPYLRPVGVGPQLVDPDLNANESVMKCNGPAASLQFVPAIQAMGPHTAPLGMVSGWGKTKGGSVGVAAWRAVCGRARCIAYMISSLRCPAAVATAVLADSAQRPSPHPRPSLPAALLPLVCRRQLPAVLR